MALVVLATSALLAQQTRDLPRVPDSGTASIEGRVVTDEREPRPFDSSDRALAQDRPLRRVRVVVRSTDEDLSRTTITDDDGAFAFAKLPAGHYTLSGTKEGYVTVNFGARRPGRSGASIALKDRQTISNLTLRLPRGAVITGMVLDADGQPLPAVAMRALRYTYTPAGERRLTAVPSSMASHVTDDRGTYRIYGLAAGEYAIAAPVRLSFGSPDRALAQDRPRETDGEVVLMTEAEIRRGLEELKQGARQQPPAEAGGAGAGDDSPRAGYAPVFYPGTTVASQAAMIAVAQGEERREVDFAIQFVPMSTIRGTVLAGEGVSSEFIKVYLVASGLAVLPGTGNDLRTGAVARDGTFSFANVAPGPYTLLAKGTRGPGPGTPIFWASTDVVADGQVQQDLVLSLQPALTIAGRVAFEGDTPPPNWERVRITLSPVLGGGQISLSTQPAVANAAGRFSISGITAGRYSLQASVVGQSRTWMLKSVVVNGRDSLEGPFDLRSSVDGALLTLTDRQAEVTGTVRDTSGQPVAGCAVVLFPPDRAQWIPGAYRIRAVTTSPDGGFSLRGLPAGNYLLAAAADAEESEWFDPMFLDGLVTSSVRVQLAEGEKKTQPLVVR